MEGSTAVLPHARHVCVSSAHLCVHYYRYPTCMAVAAALRSRSITSAPPSACVCQAMSAPKACPHAISDLRDDKRSPQPRLALLCPR